MPPSLLEVQRRLRAALLCGDDAIRREIRGDGLGAAARLSIYRNNVIGNLTGVLRLTYPAVERLVGTEFFAAAADRYIGGAPPDGADLHEYGELFAAFLEGFEPAQGLVYLGDVARLEWAVNRALHAPAVPPLAPEAIDAVPSERRADLRFVAHPSLSILSLRHPARAIWQAVLTEDERDRPALLAKIDPDAGGEDLAVLHSRGSLEVMALPAPMARLANALLGGSPLVEALAVVPNEEAAFLLGGCLASGFFSRCFPLG
ncbi:MAG: HvfC/BufC family peptide modification chaperone [Acetobacteraceae bacterium]